MPDKKTRQRVPSDAAARAGLSGAESSAPSTPRRSFEDPKDVEEQTPQPPVTRLKRSNSVSSTRSSASTSASTGSSQNPGKRIVPLYNLAVHNVVQPTVVTDAGTDSKVAKVSQVPRGTGGQAFPSARTRGRHVQFGRVATVVVAVIACVHAWAWLATSPSPVGSSLYADHRPPNATCYIQAIRVPCF